MGLASFLLLAVLEPPHHNRLTKVIPKTSTTLCGFLKASSFMGIFVL